MKYMGSKRAMLNNGLAEAIASRVGDARRFVDLFAGSGAVAWHVAETHALPVVATDLQSFATALAGAVIQRCSRLDFSAWGPAWISRAIRRMESAPEAYAASKLQNALRLEVASSQAKTAQKLCTLSGSSYVRAYGGWYFSPWQALMLDALRQEVDADQPWHDVAIAALIQAASRCAAAPGHTAQPFKSATRAAPFLIEAWKRDVVAQVTESATIISNKFALVTGRAFVADANIIAKKLRRHDLVFLDPPYSSVHYSRFYHVLESLARGFVGDVAGSGRYPPQTERPISAYSIPSRAEHTLTNLLSALHQAGATAILTFPVELASNRLSGRRIKELAADSFKISEERVSSRFSTLGGNRRHRQARHTAEEMILILEAR